MLLELVMIVKNSGEVLRKCLQSIKPYIDYWTILDTGSVDNTMDIINEEMDGLDGRLYKEDFVDFSTTRNRSLELSSKKCKYTIILDDSYVLYGGDKLRRMLKKGNNSSYSIKIGFLSSTNNKVLSSYYYSLRIVKSDENLRYQSRVHEYINDPNTEHIKDNEVFIDDFTDTEHNVRSRNRYRKDIELLLEDDKEHPNNPRTLMYLGKTYSLLKEYEKAIEYYKKMQVLKEINKEYEFIAYYDEACIDFSEVSMDDNAFRRKMVFLQKKFPERAEPYYKLCVFLYENANNLPNGYNNIVKIMDKLINLKKPELYLTVLDTSIYDYYIPYLYIDSNLKVGNFDCAVSKLREMLDIYPYDQPLLNIKYAVCDKSGFQIEPLSKGRTLVIHTGSIGWVWDPKNNNKISGSEYMAMNMAKEFQKFGYRTFIFGSFEDEKTGVDYQGIYDGIQYIDWKFFPEFSSKYIIDYLIISRFVTNLVYYDNIFNVYLWVHDILPHMSNNALVFQTHLKKFRGFIVLSNWQKKYVMNHIGIPESMMILSRNAIYSERFLNYDVNKKIPYRFIYSSDAYRGLNYLIDMIPTIKEKYPETTLAIYTRIEHIQDKTLEKIKKLDYITLNSRVSQEVIKDEYLKSDVWLYPTDFTETYCITALEAMASGCLVACTKYAGLADTVGDRGITCESPISEEKNRKDLLRKLFFVMDNQDIKKRYIEKARDWALSQTYYNLAADWVRMFKNV
jgi:glycosyltransferase involved in cell wall biosynthesis